MGYRTLLSWISLSVLVVLVCVLGVLQYRWIGEISQIERKKLQDSLQSSLNEVSRDFNSELNRACSALSATSAEVEEMGREPAYERRYARWRSSTSMPKLFSRIAVVWEQDGQLTLRMLDSESGALAQADWPAQWDHMKQRIESRLRREPGGAWGPASPPAAIDDTALIDLPRFGDLSRGPGERDWLILEVDTAYFSTTILPELLARHLGSNYQTEYQVDVFARANPALAIYPMESEKRGHRASQADASVTLFDVMPQMSGRGGGPGGPRWGRGLGSMRPKGPRPDAAGADGRRPRGPGPGPGFFSPPGDFGRGRWQLSIRLQAGSLDTVVARARQRNLAISAAILLLMLVTAGTLVRSSRRAQRLAEIEMAFVAGVSHELRTPLTVIRTAAFNLCGKLANNPRQVERYGTLIQQESQKLTAIVEQVLQFASAKGGRVIRARAPVSVESLIEDTLQSSRGMLEEAACEVEKQIEPGLPPVLGDSMALRHAMQNLIDNAVKYGMDGSKWIGVYARAGTSHAEAGNIVEIRIADRGPGIPHAEQHHLFDAFFRGKKAVGDQIHGTGLGLNLVKKIVEAHAGTVDVHSEPGGGATFIVKIPVAAAEHRHEFTHSISRG